MALNSKADYFYSQAAKRDDIVIAGRPFFKRTGDRQRVLKAEDVAWLTEFVRERGACVQGLPFRSGASIPYPQIGEHPELIKTGALNEIYNACHALFGAYNQYDYLVQSNLHFTSDAKLNSICAASSNYAEIATAGHFRDYSSTQSWTQYLNAVSAYSERYDPYSNEESFGPINRLIPIRNIFDWATGLTNRVFVRDGSHWGYPGVAANFRGTWMRTDKYKSSSGGATEVHYGDIYPPEFPSGTIQGFEWATLHSVENESRDFWALETRVGDSFSSPRIIIPGLDNVAPFVSDLNVWVELRCRNDYPIGSLGGKISAQDYKRLLRLKFVGFDKRDASADTNRLYPFANYSSSTGAAQQALEFAVDKTRGSRWTGVLTEFARDFGFDFGVAMSNPSAYYGASGFHYFEASMRVVGFDFLVDFKARNN